MGNGKSKTSRSVDRTSTPSIVADWKSEAYVNLLITSGRLAPKATESGENREAECPICFLNYEYLNTVVCCKQSICSDCFVQLKRASATPVCPFCGEKSLSVAFSRSQRRNTESGSSSSKPVYTTPEQDRKLRSMSSDEILVNPVSKQSREELEKQISTQRQMYHDPDEENRVFQQSMRRPRAVTTSGLRSRSMGSNSNSNSPRRIQRGYTDFLPSRVPENDSGLLTSLRTILGPSQLDQINSLEELEELMLLEAIRQSQSESSVGTTTSATMTPVAPTVPSPSHQSPSHSRHKSHRKERREHRHSRNNHQSDGEGQLSNSVSSSGSARLDSSSEGNNSNSQLNELAAALDSIEIDNSTEPNQKSSPVTTRLTPLPSHAITITKALCEEEGEMYDEELELALQLSLMNPSTPVASVNVSVGSRTPVPGHVNEFENSKLSASEVEVTNTSESSSSQQHTNHKSVEDYNNDWLNEFETEHNVKVSNSVSNTTNSNDNSSSNSNSNGSNVNREV